MKREFRLLTLLGCIIVEIIAGGNAGAFTFDMGSGSTVDTSGTNGVLRLNVVEVNPNLDHIFFDLGVGQTSVPFLFATIGTKESWINDDDLRPGAVTAIVDFDSPDLTQSIGGTSIGFSAFFEFVQGWSLKWNDPVRISPGSGLDFSVDLSDVSYSNWFWQGPDGKADIFATVTLNAVPIPAAAWMLGSGLLALVALKRRKS